MIRENLRFHLWAFGSLRLLLSLLDEAKLAFQLSRFNFLRRKICRNMRNISLSWLQLNLTDRNFFLSFFSARDHIISFSNFVIIQWLKKEKKREKKQGISRVPESLWKKKKKTGEGNFMRGERVKNPRHKRESKICGISKDRILGQDTGILVSPSTNKKRNDVTLLQETRVRKVE